MRPSGFAFVVALGLVLVSCTGSTEGDPTVLRPEASTTTAGESFAGDQPAPEFPPGLDWINVERPLTLAELRGKVVLLDFWTYGCINCIHVIPDLERLEAEYESELVVIGVHSAKFANEGETENLRSIVARYELEHPVVNDNEFVVWQLWGAQAWPTLVLIDPAGNIVGGHSGEGVYSIFQPVIDSLVEEFDGRGDMDRTPLELVLERDALPASVLSFPGKVLADAVGGRLFVADTNHHRIVIADLVTGEVIDIAGSGVDELTDGGFEVASLQGPQGMALSDDGTTLYVADPRSHAVRVLDLEARTVGTLAGTGSQADSYPPAEGTVPGLGLTSPWDVALDGDQLYVAMAGSHQVWVIDLDSGVARWFAGNGRESTANGPRLEAELAQPSGVAVLPSGRVVFADSESSSVRYADPGDEGVVGILAGSDASLFDFGDVDGVGTDARLQHPLGVEYGDGWVWVADTYNSKIKRLDPATGALETFAGGDQGWADGSDARFSEPGGVSYADGFLYVADTNNHAVRVIDVATAETRTIVLFGIERFVSAEQETIDLGSLVVAPGPGTLVLDVVLPDGYKINDLAPSSMEWDTEGVILENATRSIVEPAFPIELVADFGDGRVSVDLTLYYCQIEAEELCLIERATLAATIEAVDGGVSRTTLRHVVSGPNL